MDTTRAEAVTGAFEELQYDGLLQFTWSDPAYRTLDRLVEDADDAEVYLLGLTAGLVAHHRGGGDEEFWSVLEERATEHGDLGGAVGVAEVLERFVDEPVNAALPDRAREQLLALFESGFADWFLANHLGAEPTVVWTRLAEALDTDRGITPVVVGMETYGVVVLSVDGDALRLPTDVPLAGDPPVARVARASGMVEDDATEDEVAEAWRAVTNALSALLDRRVSILRVDGTARRLGRVLERAEPGTGRAALHDHLRETVDLPDGPAARLADELTHAR